MNETTKYLILAAGGFVVITAGNITAHALYTHTKIGIDTKIILISSAIGIGVSYFMMKDFKK